MAQTETPLSTRDRILAAAVEVFTRKGYAGTSTRDIAAAAGVNIATLHYHHRSKNELFSIVAEQAMTRFNAVFDDVSARQKGLRGFIFSIVDKHTELLLEYPYLVGFIQHESERDTETFAKHVDFKAWATLMADLIAKEPTLKGKDPKALSSHLIANMVGAMVYPFLFRATTMNEFDMSEEVFEAFVRNRKKIVAEMVIGWLGL